MIEMDGIIARARGVFGNKTEAARWLDEHCAALQSLGTPEGRAEILNVLACIGHEMIY